VHSLTVVGLAFGALLSGTLVEQVFSWPGLGSYAYQAASHLTCRACSASACSSA